MPAKDISRKRRKVDKASDVAAAPPSKASAAGLYLDDDAVRRSMLAMMQAKDKAGLSSVHGDGSDSGDESGGSASASEALDEDEQNAQHSEEEVGRKATGKATNASLEEDASESSEDEQPELSRTAAASSAPSRISKSDIAANRTTAPKAKVLPNSFEALGVLPTLISTLGSISIHRPTEIQSACIGPILQGRDCIGGAKTGSGKTMAFALPILQRIHKDPFGIFSVVLTPTRELAFQLAEQFLVLGKPLGLSISTVVGGMDMMQQARELCGRPHVVVATPGRLCDLLKSGGGAEWDLKRVKVLVLDEADRLLSSSFAPELQYLFGEMPSDRQTLLFTATISPTIEALADRPPRPGKQRPFVHRVEAESLTVTTLKQLYMFIPSQVRDPYLYHLLLNPPQSIAHLAQRYKEQHAGDKRKKGADADDEDEDDPVARIPSTIIFTQRCATAQLLHLILTELSIPSVPLHSHLTQPQRLLSLAQFRAGQVPVLVTTDVGSRGLDIPEVSLVVNWDCPRVAENYVHRVGRTARAGRGGVAVTIITERDIELVQGIEKAINVKLTELELPEETVLNKLNQVSTARRVATLAMHDSGFGERQKINKAKALNRQKRDAAARA